MPDKLTEERSVDFSRSAPRLLPAISAAFWGTGGFIEARMNQTLLGNFCRNGSKSNSFEMLWDYARICIVCDNSNGFLSYIYSMVYKRGTSVFDSPAWETTDSLNTYVYTYQFD